MQSILVNPKKQFSNNSGPIFIVGSPRSGTTLLRVLLNRHPNIAICDETHFFYYVYVRRKAFGDLQDKKNRQKLIDRYLAITRIRRQDIDLQALADTLMERGDTYPSFFLSLIKFYSYYIGKPRCGEKTPHHALYSELLCDWYPDCKLIHLVRDPRDVVASLMRMPWAPNSVAVNVRSWLKYVQGAQRASQRPNYLLVLYENIATDPESELYRIFKFLGESNTPEIQAPKNESGIQEVSNEWWFQRAKEPVRKDRVGIWQKELTEDQIGVVEWISGSMMQQFGYKPYLKKIGVNIRSKAMIDEVQGSLTQKLSNPLRLWYFWIRPTHLAEEEANIDIRN